MLLQLLFVLIAIIIGARLGGIGLGVLGGLGLAILTFVFGLEPTSPPIDVMLMIVAVIAAASCMQAAGGLDLMVKWAEKLLRKNPSKITLLSPLVTYIFTFIAGTGHVAYSVLPVIAEVATETKIRPERPLGIAVIASQQAITASPISAATVALLSMLSGHNISLMDILMISVPCTLIGVLAGAFCSLHVGKELAEDPEYLRRVANEEFTSDKYRAKGVENHHAALLSVIIFIAATIGIVLFGSMTELRPWFSLPDGSLRQMQMAHIIEILMLSAAALILLVTRTDGIKAVQGSVFSAGMQAVVAIFGIAWMMDTFFNEHRQFFIDNLSGVVTVYPFLFAVVLFFFSSIFFSHGATVRAIMPLGLTLGIAPSNLVAMLTATSGYFFIPTGGLTIACVAFDRTGTTKIGKWVLNHSFMRPGLITLIVSLAISFVLIQFVF